MKKPTKCYFLCYFQFAYLFHWFIVSPISATALNTSTLNKVIYFIIFLNGVSGQSGASIFAARPIRSK